MFEVEKRSLIDEKKVNAIKLLLHKKAKFVNAKKFHTLLYPKPNYLRIRWEDNKIKINNHKNSKNKNNLANNFAKITVKKGEYKDGFREEYEVSVNKKEINSLVVIFEALGFNKCSHLKSEWTGFEYKGFKIDLTKHEYLGTILEIEKMTANKKEIEKISEQIKEIMNELDLKELESIKYKKMMDKMYKDSLKSIKSQNILKEMNK